MKYSLRSRVAKGIAGGIAFAVGGTAGALITHSGGGAFGGAVLCVVLVELAINFCDNPQSLKFSIRDLLLVTALVALAVAWWIDHRRQARDIQTLLDTMRRETPWLVESDNADWVTNQMRKEAEAKRKTLIMNP